MNKQVDGYNRSIRKTQTRVKVVTLRGWDHRWGRVWQEIVAFYYKEVLWHYFIFVHMNVSL